MTTSADDRTPGEIDADADAAFDRASELLASPNARLAARRAAIAAATADEDPDRARENLRRVRLLPDGSATTDRRRGLRSV